MQTVLNLPFSLSQGPGALGLGAEKRSHTFLPPARRRPGPAAGSRAPRAAAVSQPPGLPQGRLPWATGTRHLQETIQMIPLTLKQDLEPLNI